MSQFSISTFAAKIEAAFDEADRGCGQSYELFEERFQDACDNLLEMVPAEHREEALSEAIAQGYDPDYEFGAAFAPGACSMTGIDADCCPCGRHP